MGWITGRVGAARASAHINGCRRQYTSLTHPARGVVSPVCSARIAGRRYVSSLWPWSATGAAGELRASLYVSHALTGVVGRRLRGRRGHMGP